MDMVGENIPFFIAECKKKKKYTSTDLRKTNHLLLVPCTHLTLTTRTCRGEEVFQAGETKKIEINWQDITVKRLSRVTLN